MATNSITVTIRMAWWLRWYLADVIVTSTITGLQPDPDRVGAWVVRAIRLWAGGKPYRISVATQAGEKSEAL